MRPLNWYSSEWVKLRGNLADTLSDDCSLDCMLAELEEEKIKIRQASSMKQQSLTNKIITSTRFRPHSRHISTNDFMMKTSQWKPNQRRVPTRVAWQKVTNDVSILHSRDAHQPVIYQGAYCLSFVLFSYLATRCILNSTFTEISRRHIIICWHWILIMRCK